MSNYAAQLETKLRSKAASPQYELRLILHFNFFMYIQKDLFDV